MGQESLGTATIITLEDVAKLEIDLTKITKIGYHQTEKYTGLTEKSINKKIAKDILRKADELKADLGVMGGYSEIYNPIFRRSCLVNFYQYNKKENQNDNI